MDKKYLLPPFSAFRNHTYPSKYRSNASSFGKAYLISQLENQVFLPIPHPNNTLMTAKFLSTACSSPWMLTCRCTKHLKFMRHQPPSGVPLPCPKPTASPSQEKEPPLTKILGPKAGILVPSPPRSTLHETHQPGLPTTHIWNASTCHHILSTAAALPGPSRGPSCTLGLGYCSSLTASIHAITHTPPVSQSPLSPPHAVAI